jgi:hypothetical protein
MTIDVKMALQEEMGNLMAKPRGPGRSKGKK